MTPLPVGVQLLIAAELAASGSQHVRNLRSCSRAWKGVVDAWIPALAVDAGALTLVVPFMTRLPNLQQVTIRGNSAVTAVLGTEALSALPPHLSALRLTSDSTSIMDRFHTERFSSPRMVVENLEHAILPWRKSLQHLALRNCTLRATEPGITTSDPGSSQVLPRMSLLQLVSAQATPALSLLHLTGCDVLGTLDISNCNIPSLDLTPCPSLSSLTCSKNRLSVLDLSACPRLKTLACTSNRLQTLDLSTSAALQTVLCSRNQLSSIKLSAQASLITLQCSLNDAELIVTGAARVSQLECDAGVAQSLSPVTRASLQGLCMEDGYVLGQLGGFRSLRSFLCTTRDMASLDFSACKNVEVECLCNGGELQILGRGAIVKLTLSEALDDMFGFSALEELHLHIEAPHAIDLTDCSKLRKLRISNTSTESELVHVNLTACTLLQELEIEGFDTLAALDVSQCPQLQTMTCCGCGIEVLDVSCSPLLTGLDVSGCAGLQELNTSGCNKLLARQIIHIDCPRLRIIH